VLGAQLPAQLLDRLTGLLQRCEAAKVGLRMPEEALRPRAQIVEPGLAIGSGDQPILGAAAIAQIEKLALPAVPRQSGLLLPECSLRAAVEHCAQRVLLDIP